MMFRLYQNRTKACQTLNVKKQGIVMETNNCCAVILTPNGEFITIPYHDSYQVGLIVKW
jgi:hypothetical protein